MPKCIRELFPRKVIIYTGNTVVFATFFTVFICRRFMLLFLDFHKSPKVLIGVHASGVSPGVNWCVNWCKVHQAISLLNGLFFGFQQLDIGENCFGNIVYICVQCGLCAGVSQ